VVKQNKFTKNIITMKLKSIGYIPEQKKGFQIYELLSLIPNRVFFKKTFIDWKKKTEFLFDLHYETSISNGVNLYGYNFIKIKNNKHSDQAELNEQLVDLLGNCLIYINKYNCDK